MNIRWTLPSDVSSVGDVRWALRNVLEGAGSPLDESDAAALVITELLANAIVHADCENGLVNVVIKSSDDQIHIEVTDHNRCPPVQAENVRPDALSGRGLSIVDALSSSWGWDRVDDGNRVWCDVPRSGGPVVGRGGPLHVP